MMQQRPRSRTRQTPGPSTRRPAQAPRVFEDVYGRAPEHASPAVERAMREATNDRDKKAMMGVLFGSAAPHAEKALDFLGTHRGKQVLGAAAVAAGAFLLPKVF